MRIYQYRILALFLWLITNISCSNIEDEIVTSDLAGKKVVTIGDSLTACCEWQPYLVSWFKINWSFEETKDGKNKYSPMAVGGTWVKPIAENSVYMRSFDAKYYSPDIILIYVASNDTFENWISKDNQGVTPQEIVEYESVYREKKVDSNVSTLSAYKGMIENLMEDCSNAQIYLITPMRILIIPGMNPTEEFADRYPSPRFVTMDDALEYEMTERYPKLELIKEIGRKYNLPVIDLWNMSGITNENAHEWYGKVAGDCTQVHPNSAGNRRIAECIRDFLLSFHYKI